MYQIKGRPAAEATQLIPDATSVINEGLHDINEQLFYAKDYPAMVEIANTLVRRLIKKQQKPRLLIDDACLLLLNARDKITIEQVAREACLSLKQLERKFKERTGVNPKLYERIIRFDKAFRLKNSHPGFDWLRIAVACGYHDYQHLVKAYKDLTGLGPAPFHEIENKAPERAFGLSEGY